MIAFWKQIHPGKSDKPNLQDVYNSTIHILVGEKEQKKMIRSGRIPKAPPTEGS